MANISPLEPNLMGLFSVSNISFDNAERERKGIFYYRLNRSRLNVECAYRIMRTQFWVLYTPLKTNKDDLFRIVKATCVLHNYIRTEDRPHVN